MASLTVQKRVRVSVPGFTAQTLTPGTVVQDTSPYYTLLTQDPWAANASQFSPPDDMSNIETWFDARYPFGFGGGLPANDGDSLPSWVDLMGTGPVVQSTPALQPTWRSQGMNICPPLADWTLSVGATYDPATQQISLPAGGGRATVSALLPPYANAGQLSAVRFIVEHFSTGASQSSGPKTGLTMGIRGQDVNLAGLNGGVTNKLVQTAVNAWSSRSDALTYSTTSNQINNPAAAYVQLTLTNTATDGSTTPILVRLPQAIVAPSNGILNLSTGMYARTDLYCPPCWDPQVVFDPTDTMIAANPYTPAAGRTGDSAFIVSTFLSYPLVNAPNYNYLGDAAAGGSGLSRIYFQAQGNGPGLVTNKGDTSVSSTIITPDPVSGHISAMHVAGYLASLSSFAPIWDGTTVAGKAMTDTSTSHGTRFGATPTKDPFSIMAMVRTSDLKNSLDANEIIGFLAARAGIVANMATLA